MKKFIVFLLVIIIAIVVVFVGVNTINTDSSSKKLFSKKEYPVYSSGDMINFADESWYVMYDSDAKTDYVTAIKTESTYLDKENITTAINTTYEISELNNYFKDTLVKEYGEDNLKEIHGYKIRIFNQDDLDNLTEYKYDDKDDKYVLTSCPDYICLPLNSYATMISTNNEKEFVDTYYNVDDIEDINYEDYTLHLRYYNLQSVYETAELASLVNDAALYVRPIINLYKNSIEE